MFFWDSISASILDRIFDGKCFQNGLQNRSPGRPLRPKMRESGTPLIEGSRHVADLFPGIDFSMFSGPLSAPFWARFGPFGSILAPRGVILEPRGSFWRPFFMIFHVFWKIDFGIDFWSHFWAQAHKSQRIWSQSERKNKPTNHKETSPKTGPAECALAPWIKRYNKMKSYSRI